MMISAQAAAEKTRQLVELVPAEWRGDEIKASDLAELRNRKDCEALLKEITRAVPLRLLLEHGTGSLVASTKEQLMAPYFFLSTPVEKIGSFVSHRWSADPLETAHALMGHAKLSFLYKMIVCISILMIVFFYLLPPLMIITTPMWCNFVAYAILTTRSPTVLRMLGSAGYDRPFYWFDKSTVHQKQNCLTQAGLSLFDYYLKKTDQFTILFNPDYLTRVWTVYELAWWLKHKPNGKITFVPLTTNASIYRLVLKFWPIMVSFALFGTGVMVFGCFYFSNVAQNDQFSGNLLIAYMVVVFGPCVFFFEGMFLYLIVGPARKERFQAAEQLKKFDVHKTKAFSLADKVWVEGQIRSWWSGKGHAGDDPALDAFNHDMRTTVAQRLATLQWRREIQMMAMSLFIIVLVTVVQLIGFLLVSERIRSLGWPSMRSDTARWVAPEGCSPTLCNVTEGPGHHIFYTDVECLDGHIVDPPMENCFGPWAFMNGFFSGFGFLILLCCIIGTCGCSLRWGVRAGGAGSARVTPS